MSDYRVEFIVINNTGDIIECTNTCCEGYDVPGYELSIGTQIQNGSTGTFRSTTNNRIFATFKAVTEAGAWQMGMTCPKMSHNSAYGSAYAGLQQYSRTGTPATFTYQIGQENQADWDHGDENDGKVIAYGDCSG